MEDRNDLRRHYFDESAFSKPLAIPLAWSTVGQPLRPPAFSHGRRFNVPAFLMPREGLCGRATAGRITTRTLIAVLLSSGTQGAALDGAGHGRRKGVESIVARSQIVVLTLSDLPEIIDDRLGRAATIDDIEAPVNAWSEYSGDLDLGRGNSGSRDPDDTTVGHQGRLDA